MENSPEAEVSRHDQGEEGESSDKTKSCLRV